MPSKGFRNLVAYKAKSLVGDYHGTIVRVAVALCYHRTISGVQVTEIVDLVEGTNCSAA
jgi:hypothetical protein